MKAEQIKETLKNIQIQICRSLRYVKFDLKWKLKVTIFYNHLVLNNQVWSYVHANIQNKGKDLLCPNIDNNVCLYCKRRYKSI